MRIVLFANTDWYLYNFRKSFALRLVDEGYDVLLVSPPGPYGPKLRQLGLRWSSLPMRRRGLNPISELVVLWRLWKLFKLERPSIVHGFTVKCAIYGSLAARLSGVPARVSAVTGMGYVFASDDTQAVLLRPLVRGLFRASLGGANARLILQNSDDVAEFERRNLAESSQIRVIPGSGVDLTRFGEQDHEDRLTATLTVLLAARLLRDKGLAEYAEAARTLLGEGLEAEFLLAGEPDLGNPSAVSEATVRAWQEEGIIKWLGHVSDMPSLLSRVDVMVLPSYREGLPKSLIEAAACGIPLITTDVPGCREVVTDEVDGLLIPAKDPLSLISAIRRLHGDRDLARRLGAAARAKVLREFDEKIIIEKTIAVYRELI
ncbi:MAG: glycosyltransferase family 4 protein [Gammaproteobacteria bacterium]|nr:glycosyltransferase family 4 protein [Gammaproteobacteria bacterium]